MEKKFLLLVTAIAIAKPGLAAADEKFSADSPVEKRNQDKTAIPKVEINGAADYDPRRDDTASRTVIKQDEILKYGDVNIYDVLKRAPGVTVNEKSIRLRGLGNGYTQILVNGERPPAGFSLDIVTPEQIERIEIIRAAAAEFSMQSIAGTINIVLKKVVAKAQRDLRFNVRHSADSDGLLAIGTVADKKDNLSYYLTATATRNSSRPTAYSSQRSGCGHHGKKTFYVWFINSTKGSLNENSHVINVIAVGARRFRLRQLAGEFGRRGARQFLLDGPGWRLLRRAGWSGLCGSRRSALRGAGRPVVRRPRRRL